MVVVPEPTSKKTFLVIDGTRHWIIMSYLFKKIKVKGRQCLNYFAISLSSVCTESFSKHYSVRI